MTFIYDDNYNPLIPSEGEETPPLDEVIRQAIEAALLDTHTWLPAAVVLVRSNNVVDLQPLILTRFKSLPAPLPLPIIQNCLVSTPRGTTYGLKLPIKPGDLGIALFCERSIDKWSVAGGLVDPLDARHHDLSDAVFVPGLYPFALPIPPPVGANPLDMSLYNGLGAVTVQPTGALKIGTVAVDLIKNMVSTQQKIIAALNALTLSTVNTVMGPQPLNNAAQFATLLAEVTALNTQLLTLVGV